MSASHSEGNDFDFFETLQTTGLLSYARCQVKEADQRLQSSPSNFIVLMITSSSAGKEPTCSAGDPSSIPVLGKFPGEGIDYPLQYSWASLVAQMVKNLPATWETQVQFLGWEDALEKERATHSSFLFLSEEFR